MIELEKEVLERYFEYDSESPSGLRWKIDRYAGRHYNILVVKAGTAAGSIQTDRKDINYKFWVVNVNRRLHQVHRIIYCLCHGSLDSKLYIDHIDGNSLNNKIENLRAVEPRFNSRNSKKYAANTSGVTGVYIQKDKRTGHVYIIAFWKENKKHRVKCFSVNKYGYDLAFELACKYREEIIAKLNEDGYGYTERHGE